MKELLRRLGVQADNEDHAIRGLLDAIPGHGAILDADAVIVATNEGWRRFHADHGGSPDDGKEGTNYLDCCRRALGACTPGAQDFMMALEDIVGGRRQVFSAEIAWATPIEQRWSLARMAPFEVGSGQCVLVTFENITPLRVSLAAADLLATVAARTANGVIITDADERIEWVNDAFTLMTGHARDEVVGRRPGSFLQGDGTEGPSLERVRASCRSGQSVAATLLNYRKNGEPFIVELRIDPARDAAGALTHFIAIQVDVTETLQRAEEVAAAAYAERERIAAELHDGLGQELTGAALLLTAGLAAFPPDAPGADALRRGVEAINRATASARELAHGTAPAHIHQGLVHALAALAKDLTVADALSVCIQADGDLAIAPGRAHHLYRIAQEAVTNAIRHGKATAITIEARHRRNALVLSVEDNGQGIAPGSGGFGLRMMANRAGHLHGELTISRMARGGTRMDCVVPREASAVARRKARAPAPVV